MTKSRHPISEAYKIDHTLEMNLTNHSEPLAAPLDLLCMKRDITGMSAILLPFLSSGEIDWPGFQSHVQRTCDSGLIPAVNMDTGYANLIDESDRRRALKATREITSGTRFVAGAYVADQPGEPFNRVAYQEQIDTIESFGGLPIVFQSYGLCQAADAEIMENYQSLAETCDSFLAFELGSMFAPFGKIYSMDIYRALLELPQCIGAKHSSLRRDLEWQRLRLRNEMRPDFMVLTGNDLAIDMVMYGSDYLLGLSTFCPDVFAKRDRLWAQGDIGFYQLNDILQYLGFFAFRYPTSGYKHNAAMFLNQRGWIGTDLTHPQSVSRPASDRAVLLEIGRQLDLEMSK